jgi:PBP1b-binding outer membrane lipoprotein LpoB
MKKAIALLLITILLISCSKTDTTVETNGKKDFSIQIKSLKSL